MNDAVKVELPGNWLYPDDCFVQTFSLADASALSLLPKTQDVRKVFDIMDRKINLDVKKLTLQDFWFLLYWQRINSYITVVAYQIIETNVNHAKQRKRH